MVPKLTLARWIFLLCPWAAIPQWGIFRDNKKANARKNAQGMSMRMLGFTGPLFFNLFFVKGGEGGGGE